MDRGFGKLRACLWLSFFLWLSAPRVHSESPVRVLIAADAQSEFVQRVRGQTADLPVAMEVLSAPVPATELEQLELARAHQAAALVWLEPLPDGSYAVQFLTVNEPGLSTRRALGTGSQDSSALTEVAALLVRSQLQDLLQAPAEPAPVPAPAPPPETQPVATAFAPPPTPKHGEWELCAGARAVWVSSSRVLFALPVEAAWVTARYALSASLSPSLPDDRNAGNVRIRLRQDRLGTGASALWRVSSSVQLRAGMEAGMSLFSRQTRGVSADLKATDNARTFSFFLAPRLDLRWTPRSFLALGITAGVDLLSSPTRYEVALASGRQEVERLRWAQPWVTAWLLGFSR